jgi:excisionase family DNA binding protein
VPELSFTDAELDRLADLLAERVATRLTPAREQSTAFTVATLASEIGRSERSIRAAITRGELRAIKRGKGYVISADAVAAWIRAPTDRTIPIRTPRRRRAGTGPATRALRASR